MHDIALLLVCLRVFVSLNKAATYRRVEDVDLRAGELARADAALEEQVQLREGAAARLRDAEVSVDDAEEADAGLFGGGVLVDM